MSASRAAFVLIALAACAAPRPPVRAPADIAAPPAIALTTLVELPTTTTARLRLDDAGRPYLITHTTIVPLQRLDSGEAARPFRIAGAAELEDAAWMDDGVLVIVVGQELGVVGETGFAPVATLPSPHMHVTRAAADTAWVFAPASSDGRLYIYAKSGALTEVLHAPAAITAVSGSLERAFLAIGGSILRLTAHATTELVFDGADPIIALAATPTGVMFSTRNGVFVAHERAVVRLTAQPASAIEVHGDDVILVLQGIGVVQGALGAIDRAHFAVAPVAAATSAALPEPELPSPPARAAFVPPTGPNDFHDLRLALATGTASAFTSSMGVASGPLTGVFALRVDRVWSSDLPGLVWSFGLGLDRAVGDIAHTGATLDNLSASLAVRYGFVLGDSVQVELGPVLELEGAALDPPFSSATAWGNGVGLGGAIALHYVLLSGLELGGTVSYTQRWYSLSGTCTPCTMPDFSATVITTGTSLGLSIGRRY